MVGGIRAWAHYRAKLLYCRECAHVLVFLKENCRHFKLTLAKACALSSVADIQPQSYACVIVLPKAKRIRLNANSIAFGEPSFVILTHIASV